MPETHTLKLLEHYDVAYTNVDETLLPPELHLTADFDYFRWHGRGEDIWFDYRYNIEELEPSVSKVEETTGKVKKSLRLPQQSLPWVCARELFADAKTAGFAVFGAEEG